MALINSVVFFVGVSVLVDVDVPTEVPVIVNVLSSGSVGANATAKVEEAVVETIGIIV